jgi:uncharacterized protein
MMVFAFAALAAIGSACAQTAAGDGPAQIVVSGSADVLWPVDRASFSIGISTQGISAASASAENARLSKEVLTALDSVKLKRSEVTRSQLTVSPRWEYDSAHAPRRKGYRATNTMEIETLNLSQIGTYIDAALEAGATDISQVEFGTQDTSVARHKALAQAVANAKNDAEVIAHAGGGSLGALLLLSTERPEGPIGVNYVEVTAGRRVQEQVATEVIPSQTKVTATVVARWKFVVNVKDKD